MKKILRVVFLFAGIAFAPSAFADAAQPPLKIGIIVPLSGELALFGSKTYYGARLAISEFDPKQVGVVTEDIGSETSANVAKATSKLLSIDKVNVVVDLSYLDQTLIAAPITEAAHVPLFTISLCSPKFKAFKRVACSYSSTDEQLLPLVPLLTKLNIKTLAMLVENSTYGQETDEIVQKSLASTGVKIVRHETVNPGDRDFRSLLPRFFASKPDAIFAVTADPGQSFFFFKMLHDEHYAGTRIGYLDIDPKYTQEFGKTIEGVYLPGFIAPEYARQFVDRYKAAYHRDPDMYGALGYDLFRIVAKALTDKNNGSGDTYQRVLSYHYADPAVPGYHYRPDGTISLPLAVLTVKNGQYVKAEY